MSSTENSKTNKPCKCVLKSSNMLLLRTQLFITRVEIYKTAVQKRGMMDLNYLMVFIMCQILRIILSISKEIETFPTNPLI